MTFSDVLNVAADIDIAFGVVPRRNSMPPPQLSRDTPILDVSHPVEVLVLPVLRYESYASLLDGFYGGYSERLGPHVPLIRQIRLDDRAAAVAARDHGLMLVDAVQEAH